jgi:hypothetical protein
VITGSAVEASIAEQAGVAARSRGRMVPAAIVLVSLVATFLFQEYNLGLIRTANPSNRSDQVWSLVHDETIDNVDNAFYLSAADNYLAGHGWRTSTALGYPAVGDGSYFRRVPGYSLWYYAAVRALGHPGGHRAIKYAQLLGFGLSVYMIFGLARYLSGSQAVAVLLSLLYGLLPLCSVFVYFTITEGISPFLVVAYVYFLFRARSSGSPPGKLGYYLLAAFFLGYGVLTRPYVAIAGLLLPAVLLDDYYLARGRRLGPFLARAALVAALPALMVSAWGLRNYSLTGEVVLLERAYHPESLDRLKPAFKGLLDFAKSWGEDGPDFNRYHLPLWRAALAGDADDRYVDAVLDAWPSGVVAEYGRERLFALVKRYQLLTVSSRPYFDRRVAMPRQYSGEEMSLAHEFDRLVREYRARHVAGYWVQTPLIYLRRMVLHSNTAPLFAFDPVFRSGWPTNLLRLVLAGAHVLSYLAVVANLVLMTRWLDKLVWGGVPALAMLFFAVFHREIEQRYMLPFLPLMFVGLAYPWGRSLALLRHQAPRVRARARPGRC